MKKARQATVGVALCPDRTFTVRSDSNCRTLSHKAFTLVELMVSIGVMAILAGILFSALNQNQNSPRLETAQMVLSQAFANARSQAILKQNRARLIIYSKEPETEEESEKYLRYFGVVVETGADRNQWEMTLQGEYLPEGVYFIPESSSASLAWNEARPSSQYNHQSMNLNFPSLEPERIGTGPEWSYYEFKSTGRMSGLTNKVVLAQGSIKDLKPEFPEPTALLGMVFNGYGLQFPLDEEDTL
jgi:prepilin-type N-terminal cleavage/methylation domain-containing protein